MTELGRPDRPDADPGAYERFIERITDNLVPVRSEPKAVTASGSRVVGSTVVTYVLTDGRTVVVDGDEVHGDPELGVALVDLAAAGGRYQRTMAGDVHVPARAYTSRPRSVVKWIEAEFGPVDSVTVVWRPHD